MSGSKGLKKEPKLKYTNSQVEQLIAHNTQLLNDLKSIRLPKEMTPDEYNDVVRFLKSVKLKFENAEPAPVELEVSNENK
jgi:hypothetical protein